MSAHSIQSAQPDYQEPIQNLHVWIERNTVVSCDITAKGATDRGFIPISKVEKYLQDNNFKRTKALLKAVFNAASPVTAPDVAETCPRVFCILLLLGRAKYIESFTANPDWLSDKRLPFDVKSKARNFPVSSSFPNFYDRFCEEQWRFFAPPLRRHNGVRIDSEHILPFRSLEVTGGGGSAVVFKATVHETHDELTRHPSDTHCYALKTFTRSKAEQNFQREVRAFKQITESGTRNTPGMIEFYGSFQYRDTFNIMMEYADGGTLEEYFYQTSRPLTGQDIIDFWENLFGTLEALYRIHETHLDPDENQIGLISQGWHQDLKPANILVVKGGNNSPYKWLFKVADLNLYHFKTIMEGQAEASDQDAHGTKIYGAPECHSTTGVTENRKNPVRRSVDIWSMGAILSEAAVWVVKAGDGVQEYRSRRKAQTDAFPLKYRPGPVFHDGEKRLSSVEDQHRELRPDFHQQDYVTGKVIDNMIEEMLENEEIRPTAVQLVNKSKRCIDNARDELRQATIITPIQENGFKRPINTLQQQHAQQHIHSYGSDSAQAIFDGNMFASPRSTLINEGLLYREPGTAVSPKMEASEPLPPEQLETPSSGARGGDSQEIGRDVLEANVPATPTRTPQAQRTRRQPPPSCLVSDAAEWYKTVKHSGIRSTKLPYYDQLIWELKGRDIVFMVDDSRSMRQYWREVVELIRLLAYITKRMDPDRLELYFLSSNTPHRFKNATDLATRVRDQPADKHTKLNYLLDADLRGYREAIDRSSRSSSFFGKRLALNKRSIYILTDGVLESGTEQQGYDAIRAMTEKLATCDLPRDQIGIQLIRFGNSRAGIDRLDFLDKLSRHLDLERDIVDTESSDGNIWKMLLGAINELFDDDGDDSRPLSPLSPISVATTGMSIV